ncbi:MAG: transketolase [Bacteroidales bacterium]
MTQKNIVDRSADNMRVLAMAMVEKAKSGHPGGAMGGIDFINILYSEFLQYDPTDIEWENRDRFFLDPGHMSPMLYSVLSLAGTISNEELQSFRQWKSITAGHPEKDFSRGIENTSGPLGQGHTMAVGAAIAEKFLTERFGSWMHHKIYTFISDGGIQEEISQGAGRIAGHLGLDNLVMFYDSNEIQLSSRTEQVTSEDTAKKYEAWGWKTVTIDGNDQDQIRYALNLANEESQKPFLIIGRTIMGKGLIDEDGVSFEKKTSTHGQPISKAGASFEKSIVNLGGDITNPFAVFDDVAQYWKTVRENKIQQARDKKQMQAQWAQENPQMAQKLQDFYAGKLPQIDFSKITQKPDIATRAASRAVLAKFAHTIENMVVSSADLSNSDNTDGFLKQTTPFMKGDFTGQFFEAGVSELSMGAIMNGMLLHGGVHAACGTFFVFSEFMKPAVRLAALMELPITYIWSHDAFRVGEDGPTHQPVEQEAQIRLMEHLYNHSGKRSMIVLRPADADETTVCWKIAMEINDRPTALILSRQVIKSIPACTGSTRYADALQAEKGAYVVNEVKGDPDLIIVANGSEVSTVWDGADILKKEHNITVQIVSAPSEGLFFEQDEEYQKSVIPKDKPIMAFTAGLSVNMRNLVGTDAHVWGMNSFGYSAPFQVLDEKFGYTAENVVKQALIALKKNN